MTRRRAFLASGGSALAARLSGCLGSVGLPGGPPTVREASGDPPDRTLPAMNLDGSIDATHATLVVGDGGSQGEQVRVWNGTDRSREILLEIGGTPDADPWFRRTSALASGANLAIDLRNARDYAISVATAERARTVEVPEPRVDCNDSATDVVVREDAIESRTISTQEGCGGLL